MNEAQSLLQALFPCDKKKGALQDEKEFLRQVRGQIRLGTDLGSDKAVRMINARLSKIETERKDND